MQITAYDLGAKFVGVKEADGALNNPVIAAMLSLDDANVTQDSVPWCSAYLNYIAWLLGLPRSRLLAARSWLNVGVPVCGDMTVVEGENPPSRSEQVYWSSNAKRGFDVVVLSRGAAPQPHADVLAAPGHVGLFSSWGHNTVFVLGGNQDNRVGLAEFPSNRVLGIRRLREE